MGTSVFVQRFVETSLQEKKEFYNKLTMEDIADIGYKHAKLVREDFGIQNLGAHHDIYVQMYMIYIS